jgi:hypothetical protein
MQVLQAGPHKYLALELDPELVANIAKQAGFECKIEEDERRMVLDISAATSRGPLLLFDAADQGNLGWFSRCQFYADGRSGAILQTPLSVANLKDRSGRILPNALRVKLAKELPANFRLPGRQPVTEQSVYQVLFNFLNALLEVGVGVCGGPAVKPLAGRSESVGPRN